MSERSGLLALLISDETSRRAFEETLADWREEINVAPTPIQRIRVNTRGWLALARIFAMTVKTGLSETPTWTAFAAAMLTSAALSVLLILAVWPSGQSRLPYDDYVFAVGLLVPEIVVTLLAPAAAMGFGIRRRSSPNLPALVCIMLIAMLLLTGWVFPASNQNYREFVSMRLALAASSSPQGPSFLQKGLTELSGPELVRTVKEGAPYSGSVALAHLLMRIGLVVAVPVFLLFGVAIRQCLAGRWGWGLARFAGGAAAVSVFLAFSSGLALLRAAFPVLAVIPEVRGLSIWIATFVLAASTIYLVRHPRQNLDR